MRNSWTIACATYGEITRRPIFYITLFAFAVLIYSSHFLTQFAFFQEVNMVREMGLASIALWGFVVVVSVTGVIVTQELEDRTAVTLLSKPLRRSAFLLGKYFGVMLALAAGMLVLAGVLFYTLWWMAKGKLYGDPSLAAVCACVGLAAVVAGVAGWAVSSAKIRAREADTAVEAPRTGLRASFAAIVLGAVLLLLAAEFAVGTLSQGDRGHLAMLFDQEETRELMKARADDDPDVRRRACERLVELSSRSVWSSVGSFMKRDGVIVLEGLLLCFLQVGVLGSICVSLAAFVPPVVSVAGTTLAFLLGNMSSYMLGSIERLQIGAVSAGGRLLYYLLPNLAYFNLQTHFSEGKIISLSYLSLAVLHAGLYTALAFTVSCSLFERREIR